MAVHIDADAYRVVAAKLKQAPKELKRAYGKRLRSMARPVLEEVLQEGAEPLPQGGGLAAHVVNAGRISVSQAGSGIRGVLSNKGVTLGRVDATGIVRHPLYGNRRHWFPTAVEAGTFSRAFERRADELRAEVAKAFDDLAKQL